MEGAVMTITTDDFGLVQEGACEDARQEQQDERTKEQGVSAPLDPALKQLLEKRDDRLLAGHRIDTRELACRGGPFLVRVVTPARSLASVTRVVSSATPRNAEAVIWVLLGTAVFSVFYASGKFAGDLASPLQVVFLRYVGGFTTLVCIAAMSGKGFSLYVSKQPFSHFLRAVFGCYGVVGIIYASAKMPVVDASAIGLLYVVFVLPLGMLFLVRGSKKANGRPSSCQAWGAAVVMLSRGAFRTFDMAFVAGLDCAKHEFFRNFSDFFCRSRYRPGSQPTWPRTSRFCCLVLWPSWRSILSSADTGSPTSRSSARSTTAGSSSPLSSVICSSMKFRPPVLHWARS